MNDPYCPFMGKKGKSWNELELKSIAGRVAGVVPGPVASAARELADACRAGGISLEEAKELLEKEFNPPVSAQSSGGSRRR